MTNPVISSQPSAQADAAMLRAKKPSIRSGHDELKELEEILKKKKSPSFQAAAEPEEREAEETPRNDDEEEGDEEKDQDENKEDDGDGDDDKESEKANEEENTAEGEEGEDANQENEEENKEEGEEENKEEGEEENVDANTEENAEDTKKEDDDDDDKEEEDEEEEEEEGDDDPEEGDSEKHTITGLNCEAYGGLDKKWAQKMIYWKNIPDDAKFVSPWKDPEKEKYITFEPDAGGWNNLRMSWETMVAMAHAMGRTLVMPPLQHIYLLDQYSFNDFYHVDSLAEEHDGLNVISTKEFLERMEDNFVDKTTGEKSGPPGGRTDWEGANQGDIKQLIEWMRSVIYTPTWKPDECILVFAETEEQHEEVATKLKEIQSKDPPELEALLTSYIGNPTPVDAPMEERLKENNARRQGGVCPYDQSMQDHEILHFVGEDVGTGAQRMLTHFYTFLFFYDWKQDLWTKRFIRDHLRYIDQLQCIAGKIVQKLTEDAKENHGHSYFDSMHVRRGDFQYKQTRIEAKDILKNTKKIFKKGGVLFIATDEKKKDFFKPLHGRYDVKYLDDFKDLIEGVDVHFYGMLDQLIASQGRKFAGVTYSSFTSFINRMRGYQAVKKKKKGHENGEVESYFYFEPEHEEFGTGKYNAVNLPFWAMDFPASWREIDHGVGE
eukprot:CAMPEP_0118721094 /NCGR_PEP_ID=MMETSP0800-20121206/30520_1 /TAXON_ID=210618 ORGANISM="Striatella unipunctata, Strain CCMP2910" /NCGR_SAMPLE_ID=MMETSP0800 /ASSEMBLY_ACC=CAM_ASM_000638 /LENGTH=663 /DNA_ID=CAMNT_0006628897 /DNA_START=63 /DNA_END=2054 /DNA_ORIENTATION=+